jgi:SAM-dependent methyltransferase
MTPMKEAEQMPPNIDRLTVDSFGSEWSRFDQSGLSAEEHAKLFDAYFSIFPWSRLPVAAEGFDMGCGSGRWAQLVAPRVGRLNCIDPASEALAVARRNLKDVSNIVFHEASVDGGVLPPASQDFGYSLGVLHHVPDTAAAIRSCVALLKPGAPFLLYLYYRFDNRPLWFRTLWSASEIGRATVSRLPDRAKPLVTDAIAATVYWPLARLSGTLEKLGFDVSGLPLSFYRNTSFYTMRTDSRDRFGTPLEQRHTKLEITRMMSDAGLSDILFSDAEPFWVAVGIKTE